MAWYEHRIYRSLAALFGLGRSTVGELINDTCSCIACHLMPVYVCITHGESLHAIIDGFEIRWGFPQAVGVIDGSHIPINYIEASSASDY